MLKEAIRPKVGNSFLPLSYQAISRSLFEQIEFRMHFTHTVIITAFTMAPHRVWLEGDFN